MQSFHIDLENRPDTIIARLTGDASNAHTADIHAALTRLAADGDSSVVIDLEGLSFIASTALAELIQLSHELRRSGRPLRLCGAQPAIADVFVKTRLVDVFPMYDTVDAAITAD